LKDQCPNPSLRLCQYQTTLPTDGDWWLWDGNSPFHKLGGETGFRSEERVITRATLEQYPFMHATTAVTAAIRQFFTLKTELSIENNGPTIEMFKEHFPQLQASFMSARQQEKLFDVAPLNLLHVPVAALAIGGLGVALLWRRRFAVAPELAALCLTIMLALAANAAICGIFSHPVDRYQSRLVPLAPLAIALLIARRRALWSPATPALGRLPN
jgi:hypothetical protein